MKVGAHPEAGGFVLSPPSSEARESEIARVAFVNETATDAAGTAVDVFVGAPDCEIAIRVVHGEGDVTGRVSEVPSDDAALCARGGGDARDLEKLAGVVVDAGEQYESDFFSFAIEESLDVVSADESFAGSGREFDEGCGGIEAVKLNLGFYGVLIGGKGVGFDDDFISFAGGAVERNHHAVEIYGEGVHHYNFGWESADEAGGGGGEKFDVWDPGLGAVEMSFDGQDFPIF